MTIVAGKSWKGDCDCPVYRTGFNKAEKAGKGWDYVESWCPNIRRCSAKGGVFQTGEHEHGCYKIQCTCP